MSEDTRSQRDEREERDDVALLMRVAGKRPAVPRDRFDRARNAALAEWRQTVGRRSQGARARNAWVAASVAAAAVLVLALAVRFMPFGGPVTPQTTSTARVAALVGTNWTTDGDVRRDLISGEALSPGTVIHTSNAGRVALTLESGHTVRLDRATRLRLLDAGSLALDGGAVYVDSGIGGDAATRVEVQTPLGIVREIGTQFEVRLEDDGLRVRLREGAAVVSYGVETHQVVAGGELRLDADGRITRGAIPPHAADWEWLVEVSTVPALDGQTARSFLDWVARERGWTLAFADDEVARAAATTVLGGTAEGLTVDEALDAVLPTCRLTYRVEDGVLQVDTER